MIKPRNMTVDAKAKLITAMAEIDMSATSASYDAYLSAIGRNTFTLLNAFIGVGEVFDTGTATAAFIGYVGDHDALAVYTMAASSAAGLVKHGGDGGDFTLTSTLIPKGKVLTVGHTQKAGTGTLVVTLEVCAIDGENKP